MIVYKYIYVFKDNKNIIWKFGKYIVFIFCKIILLLKKKICKVYFVVVVFCIFILVFCVICCFIRIMLKIWKLWNDLFWIFILVFFYRINMLIILCVYFFGIIEFIMLN